MMKSTGVEKTQGGEVSTSQNSVPPGYKQTKVGVIPEDWDVVKLKNVLSKPVKNGYSPICPEQPNENWILSLGALSRGRLNINSKKPAPLNDKKVKDFLLKDGDFLISRSNTPDRVGFSGVFRSKSNNYSYPDLMMRFRVDENKILISFLEYYLKASHIMRYLQLSASGSSSTMVKINKKIVENIPITICSMKEQEKIAEILTTWDDAISKQEALIKAKEELKKGLMQKLLSGEVWFDGFDGEWEEVRFNTVFERVTRKNIINDTNVLTISAQHGLINQEEFFNKSVASKDLSGYILLKNGEFAYNKSYSNGYPMGAVKRLNRYKQGVLSSLYIYFAIKDGGNADFYEQYFEAGFLNKEIYKIAQEGARNHGLLNMSVVEFFNDMHILKPPRDEQQKIAQVLTLADKEIDLLKNELEVLKEQKRGLMQKLLSGEVRMKV